MVDLYYQIKYDEHLIDEYFSLSIYNEIGKKRDLTEKEFREFIIQSRVNNNNL